MSLPVPAHQLEFMFGNISLIERPYVELFATCELSSKEGRERVTKHLLRAEVLDLVMPYDSRPLGDAQTGFLYIHLKPEDVSYVVHAREACRLSIARTVPLELKFQYDPENTIKGDVPGVTITNSILLEWARKRGSD